MNYLVPRYRFDLPVIKILSIGYDRIAKNIKIGDMVIG